MAFWAYYLQRGQDPLLDGSISSSDQVLPYFVLTALPHGVAGLIVAAILGSTMSVFSGGVNAATTSVAIDLIGRVRVPGAGLRWL